MKCGWKANRGNPNFEWKVWRFPITYLFEISREVERSNYMVNFTIKDNIANICIETKIAVEVEYRILLE